MDACEATKLVMSRIQSIDPENASRIMGYILIQDQGEKEIIRLAFGSDSLLFSCINQVKACLGLPSNNPSNGPSTTLPNPIRPNVVHNGFHLNHLSPRAAAATFPIGSPKPISYAAVLNGSSTGTHGNNGLGSSNLNFNGGNNFGDELSFGDDQNPIKSPSGRSDSQVFPYGEDGNSLPSPNPFHRRSCSVNDYVFLANLEEGGGFGWKRCVYYARGYCKNGSSCKFLHSDESIEVGSPSVNNSGFDEFLRMKALQEKQRLGFMAPGGHNPFPYSKDISFLNENQRFELSPMGLGTGSNLSARQIYLTFPAESTFNEEDVTAYFSTFGPVQGVRIPYQLKRMFGFVTFVYPETVKLILAKGNPHFVCDSRVLVKPYKDKAKLPDKKQLQQHHQHLEIGECSSGIDPRELFDLPLGSHLSPTGSRLLLNTQEMMLRRKLAHKAEFQHEMELQSRRMMNLQLMDLKNRHFLPSPPAGVPFSSPRRSQLLMSQNVIVDAFGQDVLQELDYGPEASKYPGVAADDFEGTALPTNNNIVTGSKQHRVNGHDSNFPESLEHALPDNLFASPTKSAEENQSVFPNASAEADNSIPVTSTSSNNRPALPSSSPQQGYSTSL